MAHIIKINNVVMPQPQQWDEAYEEVEVVNTTEAGTDQVNLIRSGKLAVTASFNCSSRLYETLFMLYKERTVTLKRFEPDQDPETSDTRTMRIRGFTASRQLYSGTTPGTNGVWLVSFTMNEF